jgi:hypothetical protein
LQWAEIQIVSEANHNSRNVSSASRALGFLRNSWIAITGLSLLLVIPCYWHRRIEAGDLASHTYNAWLAQLAEAGQAPGLHVVWQWQNVLVDWGISALAHPFGFIAAEKLVAAACVLCFFWGAFALIAAASQRPPWFLTPAIAMVAYGYTFYAGFLNYYLSLALAFWAVALFWRGTRIDWLLGAGVAFLSFMAHPMGFGFLVAMVAYIRAVDYAETLSPGRLRWVVVALSFLAVVAVRFYFHKYRTDAGPGLHGILFTGSDQLIIFHASYKLFSRILLSAGIIAYLFAASEDRKKSPLLPRIWTPLTLWGLLIATAMSLPGSVWLPEYIAPVSAIVARITSVTAVIGLCVIGALQPRKWIFASLTVAAVIFFALEYRDTAVLNRMEQQAESLVSSLPFGTRVSYTIHLPQDIRTNFRHFVDRACIDKCFAYSNYEPGTGQFRVRIAPGGSSVVSDSGLALELGEYVVRPEDLPMAQIYQSDEGDLTKLAVRNLTAGEKNGRVGHHYPASEIAERLAR